MNVGKGTSLLDIDCAALDADRIDCAQRLSAFCFKLLARPKIGLLRGESITMNRAFSRAANRGLQAQAAKPGLFLKQVLGIEVFQAVIFPPSRLVFASMEIEHVGKQPACLLHSVSISHIRWNVSGKGSDQRGNPCQPLGHFFIGSAVAEVRAFDGLAPRQCLGP